MATPSADQGRAEQVVNRHHGRVRVNGVLIADDDPWHYTRLDGIMERVRHRTPDEWWLRAFDVFMADQAVSTGGPLGLGVDFFADEYGAAIPEDVRQAIHDDAYEAAREVIIRGIEEHAASLAAALPALSCSATTRGIRGSRCRDIGPHFSDAQGG